MRFAITRWATVVAITILSLAAPMYAQLDGGLPGTNAAPGPRLSELPAINADLTSPGAQWVGFVGLNGTYAPLRASVTPSGNFEDTNTDLFGGLSWGVNGSKALKNAAFSAGYFGSYQKAFSGLRTDSVNQALSLNYRRQLSYRTSYSLFGNGAAFNRAAGDVISTRAFTEFNPTDIPVAFIDTKTYTVNVGAGIEHRLSERWAVSVSGGGFLTSRPGRQFIDPQGYTATVRGGYYGSARTLYFVNYGFTNAYYRRGVGDLFAHNFSVGATHVFNERLQGSLSVGSSLVKASFAQTLQIDPTLAAIIGQATSVVVAERTNTGIIGSAGLTYTRQVHRFSLRAARDINPGNGILAALRSDLVTGTYTYDGFRRISFSANGQYSRLSSLSALEGRYNTASGGFGFSTQLIGNLGAYGRYDRLFVNSLGTAFQRNTYTASAGIVYSTRPRAIPLF